MIRSPPTTSIRSYIDVPLQHASATVLKRMKRGGGADLFLRSIEKMRRAIPGVTLRTSFIVGFPGETENEFKELLQLRERRGLRLDGRLRLPTRKVRRGFDHLRQ